MNNKTYELQKKKVRLILIDANLTIKCEMRRTHKARTAVIGTVGGSITDITVISCPADRCGVAQRTHVLAMIVKFNY